MPLYRFADVASQGIIRDQYPHELPDGAWSDGANVRFVDGSAKKVSGYGDHATPSVAPYGVFYAPSVSVKYMVYVGLTKAYSWNGSGHSDISRTLSAYTSTVDDKVTACNLSGILIWSNGVDNPQSWVPGTVNICTNLANWTQGNSCQAIRAFKQHLIALNYSVGASPHPYLVKWSHPAADGALPTSWDATDTTKDAGEKDLGEAHGQILDGAPLGDVFLIWKANATFAMRHVGPPFIFGFQKVSEQSGILATNCWAETPLGIVAVSSNDVVLHVGDQQPHSVIDARNRKWLFANIHTTYVNRTFVVHNAVQSEVLICFPDLNSTGWCNKALVWSYTSNAWGTRDLPAVSAAGAVHFDDATLADVVPTVVLGSATNTGLYTLDALETDNGTSQTSRLERTGITFGSPDRVKLVRAVRPRIDGTAGRTVSVYVSGTMDFDAAASWNGPYTFTIGTSLKVDCLVSGRYFGFKFEAASTSGAPNPWRIKSFDVDVADVSNY